MNKRLHFILFFLCLLLSISFGQGLLKVSTDSSSYSQGQSIKIMVSILNNSNSEFSLETSSSCQAEFILNHFNSLDNKDCTCDIIYLTFQPGDLRQWYWTFDPKIYGLPSETDEQRLIGYFPGTGMRDTIMFRAPQFLGGQLFVVISNEIPDSLFNSLKDSLNVEVLQSSIYDTVREEIWQIYGYSIKSIISSFSNDARFQVIDFVRSTEYDSVTITGLKEDILVNDYDLISDLYPNPFNPVTSINILLKQTQTITINIYNILGEFITTLHDGRLFASKNYKFSFKTTNLPSGLYIVQIKSNKFVINRKALLIK